MQICIIAPNYMEDAWMVSAKKTAEALVKYGKQNVTVVTSNVGNYPEYEYINGVHVHRLKTWFIADPFNYAIVPGIFRWVFSHRNKFDIFIVNKYMFFTSITTPLLRLLGKKVIVQTDTFPGINWKHPTSKKLNMFMWLYARTLGWVTLKLANKVVVLHEGNEGVCKRWRLKYSVIHSGVDSKVYANAKPALDILSYKEPAPELAMVVTWVGRLDEIKGYQFYLDVAEEVNRVTGRIIFVMVCGNKYPELRERLSKKYPYVRFYGFRSDIPEVYKASDVNMLTSYDEGLPNTVMEAMASGLPIISTDVGGIPWLVKDGSGYVITHDVTIAKEYLLGLLEKPDKRKQMGIKGQQIINTEFDFKVVADNWIKEMRNILWSK